jgi:hypothetical protein
VPDILGILPDGRFLGIEVKSAKGVIHKEQLEFIETANFFYGLAFVAKSLDDVKRHLADYDLGVLKNGN